MRHFSAFFLLLTAMFISEAAAQIVPVADPEKYSRETVDFIAKRQSARAAEKIATTIGRISAAPDVEKSLKVWEATKFDFYRKVLDRQFGGALRQIVYHAYLITDKGPVFLYLRFDYKMSSGGWILSQFKTADSTQHIFPKDFVETTPN